MKQRVHHLNLKATVNNREAASELLRDPDDVVLVHRGQPRWLVMSCPDGCGEELPINLDRRTGPAWRLYFKDSDMSLFPSVWRDSGCGSHFIIWDNSVIWCEWEDDSFVDVLEHRTIDNSLTSEILALLTTTGKPLHFHEIADHLNRLPWSVLAACKELTKRKLLREGSGRSRGQFAKL